jgi:hypothetical protein
MYEQYLPNYTHDFLADSRWLSRQSAHYHFFYFPNSTAEREIDFIEKRQEQSFKKIIDFLEIFEPKRRIEYYLYPDKETKKNLMGDDWYAQAILNEFRIHILYTDEHKPIGEHEDTHLLALSLGQSIGFFCEGLAEYLVGHSWHGENHDILANEALEKKLLPPLDQMFEHKKWLALGDDNAQYYYSYAASFAKFLIEKYGKEKFKKIYQNLKRNNIKEENIKVFLNVYKISPRISEEEWKKYLSLHCS